MVDLNKLCACVGTVDGLCPCKLDRLLTRAYNSGWSEMMTSLLDTLSKIKINADLDKPLNPYLLKELRDLTSAPRGV